MVMLLALLTYPVYLYIGVPCHPTGLACNLASLLREHSASGGIGRRARFRSVCPKGCGGSTPPSRTTKVGSPKFSETPLSVRGYCHWLQMVKSVPGALTRVDLPAGMKARAMWPSSLNVSYAPQPFRPVRCFGSLCRNHGDTWIKPSRQTG